MAALISTYPHIEVIRMHFVYIYAEEYEVNNLGFFTDRQPISPIRSRGKSPVSAPTKTLLYLASVLVGGVGVDDFHLK